MRQLAHFTDRRKSKHCPSKIAQGTGKSIWVEFTALAIECDAVNLGQGFTDSPMPNFLARHLADIGKSPERIDFHQYTRGYGHQRLVKVLAKLYSRLLGVSVDAQSEVLVTVGAYLSLFYAFMGWLNPGDEVIIFEPAYDSYVSQIKMAGGVPVPVVLELDPEARRSSGYRLDMGLVRQKVTDRTKMIVLNNPNNPSGKLYSRAELEQLAELAREKDLLHIVASLPGMYERTISIGSAGKVFSATGWKTGWSVAPKWLLDPMMKIHENCVFTCPTPTQEALARAFEEELGHLESGQREKSYLQSGIVLELVAKRNLLAKYLESAGFRPIIPDGGYFMIADFSHLDGPFKNEANSSGDPLDFEFCRWLCREKKLAAIPPSAFYSPENRKGNDHFIRLCFFKKDETLEKAIDILRDSFQANK
uniref:Aminotran_1_2 domain-containing protein n=1 Tax=Globodera pallida TaxID=36090 RepID=A0A183BLC5_GLOPA